MALFRSNKKNSSICKIILAGIIFVSAAVLSQFFSEGICQNFIGPERAFAQDTEDNVSPENIIAEVNGKKLTANDFFKRFSLFLLMSGQADAAINNLTVESFLNRCLTEMLLLQEARLEGISIGKDEIEKEKKAYLERNNITEAQFRRKIGRMGLSMQDIDKYFENNLMAARFSDIKFTITDISDEQAKNFYDKNREYYNSQEKITASQILICHKESQGCKSNLTMDEAEGMAENIRRIATPENFKSLAKQYATSDLKESGGDLGVITKGSAVPAFDRAAFSLEEGEISDVVETPFGYHIIYVRGRQEARSESFAEAKDSIKKRLQEYVKASALYNYTRELVKTAEFKKYRLPDEKALRDIKNNLARLGDNPEEYDIATFWLTSDEPCLNSKGQPVILLFTDPQCPICRWISETFDETVLEYVRKGLIEAHHYDMHTKDDILTQEIEKEIPKQHLELWEQKSGGNVPYFNFGCMYQRVGAGYHKEGDLFSEEQEMRRVIEYLLSIK